jgi:hypothetical protein
MAVGAIATMAVSMIGLFVSRMETAVRPLVLLQQQPPAQLGP